MKKSSLSLGIFVFICGCGALGGDQLDYPQFSNFPAQPVKLARPGVEMEQLPSLRNAVLIKSVGLYGYTDEIQLKSLSVQNTDVRRVLVIVPVTEPHSDFGPVMEACQSWVQHLVAKGWPASRLLILTPGEKSQFTRIAPKNLLPKPYLNIYLLGA